MTLKASEIIEICDSLAKIADKEIVIVSFKANCLLNHSRAINDIRLISFST